MSTKFSLLKSFTAPDASAFGDLIQQLGYRSAAAYAVHNGRLQLLVAGNESETYPWPVTADYTSNYTSFPPDDLLGWSKAKSLSTGRKDWPKSVNFYFPEQACHDQKIWKGGEASVGK